MSLYAAMSIADGNLDPVIASRAKLQSALRRHIAQESIQMHGGIGVTAEYPSATTRPAHSDRKHPGFLERPPAQPDRPHRGLRPGRL